MTISTKAIGAVLKVGDGRGFIVELYKRHLAAQAADDRKHGWLEFTTYRVVITAAHCLPHFPPPISISDPGERTYRDLLGPLGGKTDIWAMLMFADPIADIAVLGTPDPEGNSRQAIAYDAFVDAAPTLRISDAPERGRGRLLQPTGKWSTCLVCHFGGPLWIEDCKKGIHGGMSGSPILDDKGTAIGVVCAAGGSDDEEFDTEGGPNARLATDLPGGLLCEISPPRPSPVRRSPRHSHRGKKLDGGRHSAARK